MTDDGAGRTLTEKLIEATDKYSPASAGDLSAENMRGITWVLVVANLAVLLALQVFVLGCLGRLMFYGQVGP